VCQIYLAAYTFFRFWLEFIRLYPRVAFGLTGIQLICMGVWVWLGLMRVIVVNRLRIPGPSQVIEHDFFHLIISSDFFSRYRH
jgi:prolipoprotein diacylglyceryltransferase